jgi:hypothetical protein
MSVFVFFAGFLRRVIASFLVVAYCFTLPLPLRAETFSVPGQLPMPGVMVSPGRPLTPPVLKGMQIDPQKPFQFSFLLDTGNLSGQPDDFKDESARLIRYFLAALTVPAGELWVNLSPYDKDRIIPEDFSRTEMGRDLLAQDYLLKQVSASMLHPDSVSGKRFWAEVYRKAYEMYGNTEVPTDVLNRVWVTPAKARIYEDNGRVIILEARLKVLLDREYRSSHSQAGEQPAAAETMPDLQMDDILREVIVPLLEQAVNEADHFAPLRQIYHSLILARWYKEGLTGSPLNAGYTGQNKVKGIDLAGPDDSKQLYGRYMEAFRKGAFSLIREEVSVDYSEVIARRYFSGGVNFVENFPLDRAQTAADAVVSGALLAVTREFATGMALVPEDQEPSLLFEFVPEESLDLAELTAEQKQEHAQRMARKIIWIERIYRTVDLYRRGVRISVEDIRVLIEQLLRSAPLAGIMSIPSGRRVVVFQRPGSAPGRLGLKDLNAILGESLNNLVIADTRSYLTKALQSEGLVPRIVLSDYKTTIYTFDNDADFNDLQFEQRVVRARQRAVASITERLSLELASPQVSAGQISLTGPNEEYLFPLPYGISRVAETGDGYTNQTEAVMQAERMIAFAALGLLGGSSRFYEEHMQEVIDEENQLRQELTREGFFNEQEREGVVFGLLKPEILKPLRKGTAWQDFSPDERFLIDNEGSYRKLQRYYSLLKTVDYIKQWSTDPIRARHRAQRVLVLVNALRELIRNKQEDFRIAYDPRTEAFINTAVKFVSSNSKLPEVDSEFAFFIRASGYRYPAIIAMDVVGLGLRNAEEFQVLLQSMGKVSSDQWEALMRTAADRVTIQFQEAYNRVVEKLRFWGIEDFVTRMGGDEITIMLADGYKLTPGRLFELKDLGSFRVAATRENALSLVEESTRRTSTGHLLMPDFLFEQMTQKAPLIQGLLHLDDLIAALKEDESKQIDTVRMTGEDGGVRVFSRLSGGDFMEIEDPAAVVEDSGYGGIDLDTGAIPLERSGQTFSLDWAMISEVVNIDSLVPVITGIAPVKSFGGWIRL